MDKQPVDHVNYSARVFLACAYKAKQITGKQGSTQILQYFNVWHLFSSFSLKRTHLTLITWVQCQRLSLFQVYLR